MGDTIEKILCFLTFVPPLFLLIFVISLLFLKSRGKKNGVKRFIYHIKDNKLFRPSVYISFLIPSILSILCFYWSIKRNIFVNATPEIVTPYLILFLKSLLTPTSLIAILGPTILALNYNLFKGNTADLKINNSNAYSKMYSKWRRFIDAQFDHTYELNALIIAWGAFAYQIVTDPVFAINKLILYVKMYYYEGNIICNDLNWLNCYPTLSESANECIKFIIHEPLSVVVITLAIGFVIWTFRRLISGELSETTAVEIYEKFEKDGRLKKRYPMIASRITLYRIILILFSFLYLVWSEYFITYYIAEDLIGKCSAGSSYLLRKIIQSLNIPEKPELIIFVLFVVFFILTIIIGLHYLASFRYIFRSKVVKSAMYRKKHGYDQE